MGGDWVRPEREGAVDVVMPSIGLSVTVTASGSIVYPPPLKTSTRIPISPPRITLPAPHQEKWLLTLDLGGQGRDASFSAIDDDFHAGRLRRNAQFFVATQVNDGGAAGK